MFRAKDCRASVHSRSGCSAGQGVAPGAQARQERHPRVRDGRGDHAKGSAKNAVDKVADTLTGCKKAKR